MDDESLSLEEQSQRRELVHKLLSFSQENYSLNGIGREFYD
jgi:hypothetical protein